MTFKTKEEEKHYYEQVASEKEFIEWYKVQELPNYPKPSLTVDNVIFAYDRVENKIKMLMIKRLANPYRDSYALAGGFVDPTEATEQAVLREVKEEVNLDVTEKQIEQLYTFSTPLRDPRGWVVSVSYLTFLPEFSQVVAGDDAKSTAWFTVDFNKDTLEFELTNDMTQEKMFLKDGKLLANSTTKLAFDHTEIVWKALERIQGSLDWKPKVLEVFGGQFTLPEARKVFSKFLPVDTYHDIDNSNFKKTHGHLFQEIGTTTKNVGRPAKVYTLK